MPVVPENGGAPCGRICGILLQPDLGIVQGFFVRGAGTPLRVAELFLAVPDILHWGTRVRVRSDETLAPVEELVRLQAQLHEGRKILGQRIVTEAGRGLGRCRDVQFETKTFRLEWIFPKKFLRLRTPLPASSIIEVRREAVIVRDPEIPVRSEQTGVIKVLQNLEVPVPPQPEAS